MKNKKIEKKIASVDVYLDETQLHDINLKKPIATVLITEDENGHIQESIKYQKMRYNPHKTIDLTFKKIIEDSLKKDGKERYKKLNGL